MQPRRITGRWTTAIALALAALVLVLAGPAGGRPSSVVSLNICTDQLAIQLIAPDRIASVSFLAADPHYSAVAERARDLPLNRGDAEEVLRLDPDLVLAGTYTSRPTVRLLRRLGHDVVEVAPPSDLDAARAQIRTVAKALGVPERGEDMIARIDRRLDRLGPDDPDAPRPTAAVYQANGITPGRGELAHAVLRAAGLANLAAERGVRNLAPLPLEALVMAKPDVLVFVTRRDAPPSQATRLLDHPALEGLKDQAAVALVPPAMWNCGGPQLVKAVKRLADARERAFAVGRETGGRETGGRETARR